MMIAEGQFSKFKETLKIDKKVSLESDLDNQLISYITSMKSEISIVFICKSTIEDINNLVDKLSS